MARIEEIAQALREAELDGWLFYDFRMTDPLAYRILGLPEHGLTTRRWLYFIPASGTPQALVSAVEAHRLDALPTATRDPVRLARRRGHGRTGTRDRRRGGYGGRPCPALRSDAQPRATRRPSA